MTPLLVDATWLADHLDELIVADLDLDEIKQVRTHWQFYRDRRPDMYGPLTK